jgi:hypothetical protein
VCGETSSYLNFSGLFEIPFEPIHPSILPSQAPLF